MRRPLRPMLLRPLTRRRLPLLHLGLALALLGVPLVLAPEHLTPAGAEESADPPPAQKGDRITWVKGVAQAFEKAAAAKKPIMICINSKRVDGGKEEPAGKWLRDEIYLDPRVVTKSRKFVCVFLTSEGSSSDYGELRLRFGIDGLIVSPQHVFARHDHETGHTPLVRKEFWPYGNGERGVKNLLEMMDKALAEYGTGEAPPDTPAEPGGDAPGEPAAEAAPQDDDARLAWIKQTLAIARGPIRTKRREALRLLMTSDKEGDCITPVIASLPEIEEDLPVLIDTVRALGRDNLVAAAEPIEAYLKHKDDDVRANAAVTLEYIGSPTSAKALQGRFKREKVENIANHLARALGRCGAGDAKVRAFLAKEIKGAKTETAAFGPIVGMAYFEGDAKAARAVEKLMKQIGPPSGGRRGGWQNAMKRTMLAWCLSEIGDKKSADFIKEDMLKPLEHAQGRMIDMVVPYYEAVAASCGGDKTAKDTVGAGTQRALEWSGGTTAFRDEARKERDVSTFEPKADWDVEARDFGGFGGRGGGGKK
jgi:hypothetical protein